MTIQARGDAPWFVRESRGLRCNLRPSSRAGWLITILYALTVTGMSVLLLTREEAGAVELVSWGLMTAAMTVAFLVTAWRTSEPAGDARSCGAKDAGNPKRAVVIALLSAVAIIGAALLGVEI